MADEKLSGAQSLAYVVAGIALTAFWIFTDTKLWNWYVAPLLHVRSLELHEMAGVVVVKFALFPPTDGYTKKASSAVGSSIAMLLVIWSIVLAIRIAGY